MEALVVMLIMNAGSYSEAQSAVNTCIQLCRQTSTFCQVQVKRFESAAETMNVKSNGGPACPLRFGPGHMHCTDAGTA